MREYENLRVEEAISNCLQCSGKMIYKGSGCYVCESCGEEILTDFGKVKRFIQTYGPSNAITISRETGVSRGKIQQFLREGRVEVVEDGLSNVSFCVSCGVPIRSGKYCNVCQSRMAGVASRVEQGVFNALSENEIESQKGQKRFKN